MFETDPTTRPQAIDSQRCNQDGVFWRDSNPSVYSSLEDERLSSTTTHHRHYITTPRGWEARRVRWQVLFSVVSCCSRRQTEKRGLAVLGRSRISGLQSLLMQLQTEMAVTAGSWCVGYQSLGGSAEWCDSRDEVSRVSMWSYAFNTNYNVKTETRLGAAVFIHCDSLQHTRAAAANAGRRLPLCS